jgi:Flp pilus assembly pilin Flp
MGNGLGIMLGGGISGSNYFFPSGWVSLGRIDGELAGDESGISVSLNSDGTIVAIGAYLNDGSGSDAGCVRVYENVAGTWSQVGVDIDGEAASDYSGFSVSLSSDNGDIVAIGARYNNGNGSDSGHVRVYQNLSGTWTQIGSDIDGEAAFDYSGISVSLSSDGSILAIGANGNDGNGGVAGHVRVYQNVDGTWTQVGVDIDGEAILDFSGSSVSLSSDGSILAIGAWGNDGSGEYAGHVRVYQNVDGTWTQVGVDIDGELAGDESGISVSLSADGSILAIGAHQNDGNGGNSGHVRVYQNVDGTWTQMGSDINGEAADDRSGRSVSLSASGSRVAIGAPNNDGNGSNAGHVRVYKYTAGAWTQVGLDIDGEAAGDLSGYSVSLNSNGNTVAIGSPYNDGNGSNSGKVHIYKLI